MFGKNDKDVMRKRSLLNPKSTGLQFLKNLFPDTYELYVKGFAADTHLHLDGSLSDKTILSLIKEQPKLFTSSEREKLIRDSEYRRSQLIAPRECESLNEYLKCFDLPLKLLRTPEAMYTAGRTLAEELASQGLKYAEIRFAPQLHSIGPEVDGRHLDAETEIISALLDGIESVTDKTHLNIGVILCMMRNLPEKDRGFIANIRTLFLAKQFLGKGVVAVDLAGAEARDSTAEFEKLFCIAKDFGIPFTIHAGEAGDDKWRIDSIERAIAFGAKRIGHGVGLEKSKELRHIVRDAGIVVECCLSSNIHTKAVTGGIDNHPIKLFLNEGLKVTLNTDNMTVSSTTLAREYLLAREIGLTNEDIRFMQQCAIDGAFMSNAGKKRMMKKYGYV